MQEETEIKQLIPRSSMSLSLGIDVGTTAIKMTVIDPKGSRILAVNRVSHGSLSAVNCSNPTFNEQDPVLILKAVDECIQGIPTDISRNVSVISISGQMHGAVIWSKLRIRSCMDKLTEKASKDNCSGLFRHLENILKDCVTNLITWQDGRCSTDFLDSLPKSSNPISTGFGCASLFWMQQNNPEILHKFDSAGSIMDLLVSLICDLHVPIMSPQIAHSWGYFDTGKSDWQYSILRQKKFPEALLPKILKVGTQAGALQSGWHGIPQGTRVNVPIGDFQCSMLASLKDHESAALNLGTSAQLAAVIPASCRIEEMQAKYPGVQIFPYFKQTKVAVAASLNGGNAVDSFVNMLGSWLADLGIEVPRKAHFHTKFNEFCTQETANDSILQIKPIVLGERHCPHELASVTGISKGNIALPTVVQGLYKGIIDNIFAMMPTDCLEMLGVSKIVGTGSVFANNKFVRETVEKLSGMPCIGEHASDASYGAALASD